MAPAGWTRTSTPPPSPHNPAGPAALTPGAAGPIHWRQCLASALWPQQPRLRPALARPAAVSDQADHRAATLYRSETRFRAASWRFAAGHRRGWDHLEVLLSLLYRLVRCLLGLFAVLVQSDLSK